MVAASQYLDAVSIALGDAWAAQASFNDWLNLELRRNHVRTPRAMVRAWCQSRSEIIEHAKRQRLEMVVSTTLERFFLKWIREEIRAGEKRAAEFVDDFLREFAVDTAVEDGADFRAWLEDEARDAINHHLATIEPEGW